MSANRGVEIEQLLRAGRQALRPSVDDKQRILAALRTRMQQESAASGDEVSTVGQTAANNGAAAQTASTATSGKLAFVAGGLLASFATIMMYLSRANVEPSPLQASAVSSWSADDSGVTSSGSAATESALAPIASAEAASSVSVVSSRRSSAARGVNSDTLAAEAALLSQAEKALHSGNLSQSLRLTSEHRTRFPQGVMARERVNIRVQSLCGLGREREADDEYARMQRRKARPGEACRR
jgi:hypothetical protein